MKRRSWASFCALALWLGVTAPAAALQLLVDDPTLTARERDATQQLVDETRRLLPPILSQRLDRSVVITWNDRLPADVIGRLTPAGKIQLNGRWLAPLLSGAKPEQLTGRVHGGLRSELHSTIIHELAHLYDRAQVGAASQRTLVRRCRWQYESTGLVGLLPGCRGHAKRQRTLSDDPRLLDLAGWSEQTGRRGQRFSANDQTDRTPDEYELTSPAEFVAVNLEYFLLDPEYACRRPALFDFFVDHFGWAPASAPCPQRYAFSSAGLRGGDSLTRAIDPARVYAVHYLLAEPNQAWASRWGHSMLRLVMCAPGREPGPDCLLDLEHHLVLSFRAFVGDLQLSSWDGLTGEYPSRLFILPLSQVVDEYTRLELRGLQSIPLAFSATQRAELVRQAAQLHWSYDGRYYFVSNNCAVETLKLLRVGTRHARLGGLETLTPTGLLGALEARGLADSQVLADRRAALRQGFYFDSQRERYERMLAVVREELGGRLRDQRTRRIDDLDTWLVQPAASRRRLIAGSGRRALAALLLLEQAALDRQMLLAQQALRRDYLAGRDSAQLREAGSMMAELLDQSRFVSRPAELVQQGYGLPYGAELAAFQRGAGKRHQQWQTLAAQLEQQLPALLSPAQRRELEGSRFNLELIGERLRSLHRKQGGLRLP